jgi:hypothetical protein
MTIHIGITLFPNHGNANGRMVSLAAWSHKDAPVVDTIRSNNLGSDAINTLLLKLQNTLPSREQIAIERQRLEQEKTAKEAEEKKQRENKTQQKTKPRKTPQATSNNQQPIRKQTAPVSIPTPQQQNPVNQKQQSLFGE